MNPHNHQSEKRFYHEKGVTYFSKETERYLFFGVTLCMFAWILLEKIGIL